jgi:excisionase family DNA binding protein
MSAEVMNPPELVTADELARMLSVSRRHIERLSCSGRLPPVIKLGRLTRWHRATVMQWLASGCPPEDDFHSGRNANSRGGRGRAVRSPG